MTIGKQLRLYGMTKVRVVWKRYRSEEMADYVQSLLSTEISVVRVWSVQHEVEVSVQWFTSLLTIILYYLRIACKMDKSKGQHV